MGRYFWVLAPKLINRLQRRPAISGWWNSAHSQAGEARREAATGDRPCPAGGARGAHRRVLLLASGVNVSTIQRA
ncbi:hypothetical protein ACGF3C_25260 [Micromonospora sp. NPDC047762]|uniref:hypothetical protein n=1 Tax=Micromonospora sp. NPDC047762 TaxID=3364255 RepID=UPI003711F03C